MDTHNNEDQRRLDGDRSCQDRLTETASWSTVEIAHSSFTLSVRRLQQDPFGFDLWSCCTKDVPGSVLDNPHRINSLSSAELKRYEKFRFARHRDLFLTTRLLVRSVLSQYAEVQPESWTFTQNEFGRPEIGSGLVSKIQTRTGSGGLRFSLSRSGSLALCAVSKTGIIGVDLEDGRRKLDAIEVATGVLAGKELLEVMQTPGQDRTFPFLNYWVLKEAYVKARGLGLTLDVKGVAFNGIGSSRIQVEFADSILDAPDRWLFRNFVLFDRYVVATAFSPDNRRLASQPVRCSTGGFHGE